MEPIATGIAGVIVLFILIFLGLPVAAAMGSVAIVGLAVLTNIDGALSKLALTTFHSTASYIIAVIPLFVLMGEFANAAKITQDAYLAVYKWVGRLPGGLAVATIGACAFFAAACGSSSACASAIASVALPEMRKYKYDAGFSLATIGAGGTLGILIPPSTAFVLYGIVTEQSIGKLFLAGVFPGVILSLLFSVSICLAAILRPTLGARGPATSWREKITALKGTWGVVLLFLLVIGGIYVGVFTPTEAAGVGAFAAFVLAIIKKQMSRNMLIHSFREALSITGLIFVMIIGATLFGVFLAISNITIALGTFVTSLPVSPIIIIICILGLYMVLGCVMDAFSMMLIMTPIVYPTVVNLGFDPIWFGVLTVIMVEMGLITPPIGLNIFIMAGIAPDVPMYAIFRHITIFVISMIVCVAIIIAFPQIALLLPNLMK